MTLFKSLTSVSIVLAFAASADAQDNQATMKSANPSVKSSLKVPEGVPVGTPTSVAETPSKLTLKTGIYGKTYEDRQVNSKVAGATIDLVGSRKFFQKLAGRIDITYFITTGIYSNQYRDEGSAPNAIYLNEAAVQYDPFSVLSLEAGVMPPTFTSHPSVFDANGFPSLRQTFKLEGDFAKGALFAMEAIPTASTRAVKPAQDGITTTFNAVGLSAETNPKDRGPFTIGASVMGWEFRGLNTSAAADSQYLGNTIVSPGPQPRFKYGFAGYETAGSMKLKLTSKTHVKLGGAFLRNEEAPTTKNQAYSYTGELKTPVSGIDVSLIGTFFYTESDTLPGSYALFGRNFNNRFGNIAKVKFESPEEKVSGYIQYVRANEIEDRPFTADRDTFSVGLEAAYDVL